MNNLEKELYEIRQEIKEMEQEYERLKELEKTFPIRLE